MFKLLEQLSIVCHSPWEFSMEGASLKRRGHLSVTVLARILIVCTL